MLSLLWSRPGMRVYCRDPSGVCLEGPGCGGFPTAMTQRKQWRGAVGWGYPEWVEPGDMDPGEKGSRGRWSQGWRAWYRLISSPMKPKPRFCYSILWLINLFY